MDNCLLIQVRISFARTNGRKKGKKVKEVNLYSASIVVPHTQGAQVRITQCYLHRTCLYLVSVHQMAPPQTEVADN